MTQDRSTDKLHPSLIRGNIFLDKLFIEQQREMEFVPSLFIVGTDYLFLNGITFKHQELAAVSERVEHCESVCKDGVHLQHST
jgi:hypothetical protein